MIWQIDFDIDYIKQNKIYHYNKLLMHMICVKYIKETKYLYSYTYIHFICIQIKVPTCVINSITLTKNSITLNY